MHSSMITLFFFFNDTATTEIYTLPYTTLFRSSGTEFPDRIRSGPRARSASFFRPSIANEKTKRTRSEEHTSELQSQFHLVCRLLLEKKNEISYLARSLPKPIPFVQHLPLILCA